jgi:recombination protein RecA
MAPKKMSEVEAPKKKEKPDDSKPLDIKGTIRTIRTSLNKDDEVAWDLTKDDSPTFVRDWISTGSTILDYIISNRRDGGIPCGKITELQGEESSGKSLLCAHIIANTQRKGGIAVYLDTENAANPEFMQRIGVDLEKLIYIQPQSIEAAFGIIEQIIMTLRAKSSTQKITILWDSVGNTPPQAEIEGSFDPQARMGLGAKAMAIGLRKTTGLIGREQITMVMTQPLTYRMDAGMYGDPLGTKYGKALPYHSSIRLRVSSSTKLKDKAGEIYGLVTNGRVMKSRLGTSHRTCKFEIHFDFGIDDEASWYLVLHEAGLIDKKDGWCYLHQLPSGRIWDKGVDAGKDRGIQFREAEFGKLMRENKVAREYALNSLEQLLIVKYEDSRPVREGEEVPNDTTEDVLTAVKPKGDEDDAAPPVLA